MVNSSMEQHPVPQHIASFQFKLFGDLTIRQFMFLIGPMILAGLIFFSAAAPIVRIPLSVVIALVGLFVALVPVQGRPFDKWIVAFIRAVFNPTQRVWIKETRLPAFLSVVVRAQVSDEKIPEEITERGRERLVAYLKSLPRDNESPLDIREEMAVSQLGLTADNIGMGSVPPPIIWPSAKREASLPAQITSQPETFLEDAMMQFPASSMPGIEVFHEKSAIAPKLDHLPIIKSEPRVSLHAKPYMLKGIEDRLRAKQPNKVEERITPYTHLASDTNFSVDNIISVTEADKKIHLVRGVGQTRVRKLHFAPPENFDLSKLPIRGERRFEISDELAKRFNFEDESPETVLPSALDSIVNSVQVPPLAERSDVNQTLPKVNRAPAARRGDGKLKNLVTEPAKQERDFGQKFSVTDKKQVANPSGNVGAQIIPLTSTPNVISGLVTDAVGTPLEGAVLVVRDGNGIPVRALKTNKLGQFLSATPLTDGKYTVEIESDHAIFVPTAIDLKGDVVQPLGLQGKTK